MIQFPSRKESVCLVNFPDDGTDTVTHADQLDIEPNEMWHHLNALKRKHFIGVRRSKNYKNLKSHRWVLTKRGQDLKNYIKKYGNIR